MKLTVITPCLNSEDVIERAINSVLAQDYPNWEHIIIDGGSKDKTLEIIGRYKHLIVVSGPDKGQADAMNKGIDLASGDYVGFLNADDYYFPGAFSRLAAACSANTDLIVGNIVVKSKRLNHEFINTPRTTVAGMMRHWEPNAFPYNPVGYFCRTSVQKVCRYNTDNYESMDLEFLLTVASQHNVQHVDYILGCFEDSYNTKTDKTQLLPDYWRPATFPYIDRHLKILSDQDRQSFVDDRRKGYAEQQANTNSRARARGTIFKPPLQEPLISVVIPTYNDVHVLGDAIVSVLNQSYKNIQILIVDDAGPHDVQRLILDRYTGHNVQVIRHTENKMLGGARNTGIDGSKGDFVMFLDADDILLEGAIEKLVSIALQTNADVVQGGTIITDQNGDSKTFHAADFASDGGVDGLYHYADHQFASLAWNKLYKAEFLRAPNGPRFAEKFAHEDVVFSAKVAFQAQKIVSISDPIVNYRYNSLSITRKTPGRRNIESYFFVYFDLVAAINEFHLDLAHDAILIERIIKSHIVDDFYSKMIHCWRAMPNDLFAQHLNDISLHYAGLHSFIFLHIFEMIFRNQQRIEDKTEPKFQEYASDLNKPDGRVSGARSRPCLVVDGIFWQYNNTGIAKVWEGLLRCWAEQGLSDNIIVLDRAGSAVKVSGIKYYEIQAHNYSAPAADSLYLQNLCNEMEADLFVSTYYSTPIETRSFFVGYDMIPERFGYDLSEPMWREKRKAILHANAHSMISKHAASDLEEIYPQIRRGSTVVAHPGIGSGFVRASNSEVAAFRRAHGIDAKPYLIFVGKRVSYKNGELVFRALKKLKDNYTLVCVGGDIELEAELLEFAEYPDVRHLFLSDAELAVAYSGAHCLVYPSKYEGFGLPPLESMACGTPAVVCRSGAVAEVVGDAAVFVDESDPDELIAAVNALRLDSVRAPLVSAGYVRAKQFSIMNMASTLWRSFTDVITVHVDDNQNGNAKLWRSMREAEANSEHRQGTTLSLAKG